MNLRAVNPILKKSTMRQDSEIQNKMSSLSERIYFFGVPDSFHRPASGCGNLVKIKWNATIRNPEITVGRTLIHCSVYGKTSSIHFIFRIGRFFLREANPFWPSCYHVNGTACYVRSRRFTIRNLPANESCDQSTNRAWTQAFFRSATFTRQYNFLCELPQSGNVFHGRITSR